MEESNKKKNGKDKRVGREQIRKHRDNQQGMEEVKRI